MKNKKISFQEMENKLSEDLQKKLKNKSLKEKLRIIQIELEGKKILDETENDDENDLPFKPISDELDNRSFREQYVRNQDIQNKSDEVDVFKDIDNPFSLDNLKKQQDIENKKTLNKNNPNYLKTFILIIGSLFVIFYMLKEMEGEGFFGMIFILIFTVIYLGVIYKGSNNI